MPSECDNKTTMDKTMKSVCQKVKKAERPNEKKLKGEVKKSEPHDVPKSRLLALIRGTDAYQPSRFFVDES